MIDHNSLFSSSSQFTINHHQHQRHQAPSHSKLIFWPSIVLDVLVLVLLVRFKLPTLGHLGKYVLDLILYEALARERESPPRALEMLTLSKLLDLLVLIFLVRFLNSQLFATKMRALSFIKGWNRPNKCLIFSTIEISAQFSGWSNGGYQTTLSKHNLVPVNESKLYLVSQKWKFV